MISCHQLRTEIVIKFPRNWTGLRERHFPSQGRKKEKHITLNSFIMTSYCKQQGRGLARAYTRHYGGHFYFDIVWSWHAVCYIVHM